MMTVLVIMVVVRWWYKKDIDSNGSTAVTRHSHFSIGVQAYENGCKVRLTLIHTMIHTYHLSTGLAKHVCV
jgi:hypothetical protein